MYRKLTIEKPLTNGELKKIDQRIDEIDSLLETYPPDDIYNNLIGELDFICEYIENSLRLTKIYEKMQQKGFRLVS